MEGNKQKQGYETLKILTAKGDQPQWDHVGVSQPLLLSSTCRQSGSESSIWTSRYLCVRPVSRHADACPAAAGTQGLLTQMWWTCKTLRSCRREIHKSTGFRTFNTLNPSCTSFSFVFLIMKLKAQKKHSWMCYPGEQTGPNLQNVHILMTP